ncbi:NAD kinase [Corynebacterium mendelii]|uniref:NAD kinase n=1 Tax=Corynebacterium mendelii TaxID=2765362 RepID=A0A939E129_9CORY|nr:NAD kinase [Corynebacterium mendelii]
MGTGKAGRRRDILLVPHTGRSTNLGACAQAAAELSAAGIGVRVMQPSEGDPAVLEATPGLRGLPRYTHSQKAAEGVELILVLGGDGTFLRAADVAHGVGLPVLGINLGHVGFLAEWEQDSLALAIKRVVEGQYWVTDRMTIDVRVFGRDGNLIGSGWALNEVSIDNLNRRGVLDAILEIDGHPVSSFGCDGVIVSSPTGSTAYAFSAGGPVLWPELDAILVVPNNAHALFTKPLVVSPDSTVVVETAPSTQGAVAVMDGFRDLEVPPGARVEVVRGVHPIRWVRLDDSTFTDRLVTKFRLPVSGWRGPAGDSDCNCDCPKHRRSGNRGQ